MATPISPARAIGEMAAALRLGDIPPDVVMRAKLHILDALGLAEEEGGVLLGDFDAQMKPLVK